MSGIYFPPSYPTLLCRVYTSHLATQLFYVGYILPTQLHNSFMSRIYFPPGYPTLLCRVYRIYKIGLVHAVLRYNNLSIEKQGIFWVIILFQQLFFNMHYRYFNCKKCEQSRIYKFIYSSDLHKSDPYEITDFHNFVVKKLFLSLI